MQHRPCPPFVTRVPLTLRLDMRSASVVSLVPIRSWPPSLSQSYTLIWMGRFMSPLQNVETGIVNRRQVGFSVFITVSVLWNS